MYQALYYYLFNKVTDALTAMEERNYGQAEQILKQAQQHTEELYITAQAPAALKKEA